MGAAASTLARPGWIEAAVKSEPPPDPRWAGSALGESPAAAPAYPAQRPKPGSAQLAHRRRSRARPAFSQPPGVLRLRGAPAPRGCFPPPSPPASLLSGLVGSVEAERGRQRRRGGGGRGGRSREEVACPSPGGGGGGGRGKTMPRLSRGGRRERARRAGRPGAGRLRGGACRSEAPASAPLRPDAAGDRPGLRQQPPSPPPPPGGPSKSLDLGEDAALRGLTARARRRPREPSQVTRTPNPLLLCSSAGLLLPPRAFPDARPIPLKVRGRRSSRSRGRASSTGRSMVSLGDPRRVCAPGGQLCREAHLPREWVRTLGPSWCLLL